MRVRLCVCVWNWNLNVKLKLEVLTAYQSPIRENKTKQRKQSIIWDPSTVRLEQLRLSPKAMFDRDVEAGVCIS